MPIRIIMYNYIGEAPEEVGRTYVESHATDNKATPKENIAMRVIRKATRQEYLDCLKSYEGSGPGVFDSSDVEYYEIEILD